MNHLPVFALPEVEGDLRSAMAHYASWRTDGAEHIRKKYDETSAWIGQNSDALPKKYGQVRRAILRRSYYVVYFVEEQDRAVVVAVLDARRDIQRRFEASSKEEKSEPGNGRGARRPAVDSANGEPMGGRDISHRDTKAATESISCSLFVIVFVIERFEHEQEHDYEHVENRRRRERSGCDS